MPEKVLAIHASVYDFKDQESGKQVSGTKLSYLPDTEDPRDDATGIPPLQLTGDKFLFQKLQNSLPAIIEIETRMVPGRRGTVQLALVDAKVIAKLDLLGVIRKHSTPSPSSAPTT